MKLGASRSSLSGGNEETEELFLIIKSASPRFGAMALLLAERQRNCVNYLNSAMVRKGERNAFPSACSARTERKIDKRKATLFHHPSSVRTL